MAPQALLEKSWLELNSRCPLDVSRGKSPVYQTS